MKKDTNKIIGVVVAIIIVGAASFYGGMLYGKSAIQPGGGQFGNMTAQQRQALGARRGTTGQNGGFVTGQILSKDNTSITVQIPNAGSKIVFYSTSTSIGKTAAGSSADLTAGENVSVNGTANSDGSVTATSIQIRPAQQEQPQQAPPAPANQ